MLTQGPEGPAPAGDIVGTVYKDSSGGFVTLSAFSREVSARPPWSMETSTITAPCFMAFTVAAEISFGALAPGTSTAPIMRSARWQRASIACGTVFCGST